MDSYPPWWTTRSTCEGFSRECRASNELLDGLPFLDLQLVMGPEFALFVEEIFATDRDGVTKGMVEVIL